MPDDLTERVKAVIARQLGVQVGTISKNSDFFQDLGADSLDTIEIVAALEDEFDCAFPDTAEGNVRTLGDLTDLLTQFFSDPRISIQRLRAAELAGSQIDNNSDKSVSSAVNADRRRELVEGPEMVRKERIDRDR